MKIKFCGAARTVTGSQHLLEISGKKILLDCGLFQGRREEAFKINRHFPFDPGTIHCVVLSHAHMDHSGNLPTLFAKGFKGDIYTTTASRDLCAVMLQDSAHIQARDVEFVNKKRAKNNEPAFNPLYGFDEVREVMKLFKSVSYRKKFYIDGLKENVSVTYFDAGHILGSGSLVLDINENGKNIKLGFTGDLGRFGLPLLKDPEFMGNVNYVISESTYGGRVHDKAAEMELQFETAMKEAIAKGRKNYCAGFQPGQNPGSYLYSFEAF